MTVSALTLRFFYRPVSNITVYLNVKTIILLFIIFVVNLSQLLLFQRFFNTRADYHKCRCQTQKGVSCRSYHHKHVRTESIEAIEAKDWLKLPIYTRRRFKEREIIIVAQIVQDRENECV